MGVLNQACMDAPKNANIGLESSVQCGQALSCIRPLDCGVSHLPRAHMEMRGPGPNRLGELDSSRLIPGFPDPVSMTICPYSLLRPAHIPGVIRTPAAQAAGSGSR